MPAPHLGSLGLSAFAELGDGLPTVLACAKDPSGRYVYANRSFAARAGRRRVADVIGRRVGDLFDDEVAASITAQDDAVLATGRPLQNHLEAIIDSGGRAGWWTTSKARFLADDGSVLGLVCLSIPLSDVRPESDEVHRAVADVIAAVKAEPSSRWRTDTMCAVAGLTPSQLPRALARTIGLSPTQLLDWIRVDEAMHLLSHGEDSLGQVAAACGFYDQSNLTRRFRLATGYTPGAYRSTHPYRRHVARRRDGS